MTRDLDYRPLTQRAGVRDRLRALGRDNAMVMGTTVVALLVVIPPVILIALVATGNATDPGGVVFLVLLIAAGAYATWDVIAKTGAASALQRFAEVNDLEPLGGSTATHYGASVFADGSHMVRQGVRTREAAFVEVGDRFRTDGPRHRHDLVEPEVYVRVRLPGLPRVRPGTELLTPDLHGALAHFAGTYAVEVTGKEVTVLGSRSLDPDDEGRVAEAFAIADALQARAIDVLVAPAEVAPAAPGAPTSPPVVRRPPSPWRVVGWTLALVIVVPIGFAVVMGSIDDWLRTDAPWAIPVVVGLLISGVFVAIRWVLKKSVTPGDGQRKKVG